MRVNGIIAEYNPFHNGHKYHLETSRQRTDADYTIVAMSGNFMQRGTPALLHKYARAQMALQSGADLVLEIPPVFACASAEYYASGAVAMLDSLGVTDYLCFGSECGDLSLLRQIAKILAEEPAPYRKHLNDNLKKGYSYPAARSMALTDYCPSLREAADVFTTPNNILGIEYIKALLRRQSSMQPVTIKRAGAQYHDTALHSDYPSATAIRHTILKTPDNAFQNNIDLPAYIPDSALAILLEAFQTIQPIQPDDFSQILLYRLLTQSNYEDYLDVGSDLSDKIRNALFRFRTFESFCDLLKSKDTTHTRLSRALLHILLDIKTEDMSRLKALNCAPYARVLGLRRDAAPLLCAIKQHSSIPLITKLADADKLLNGEAFAMLQHDIRISHIYNMVESSKCGIPLRNEYRTPITVI